MPAPASSRSNEGLAAWLLLVALAAVIGSVASLHADTFYAQLARPAWAPPAWLFAPVWTLLYVMMAIAAWLAWRRRGWRGARFALALFVAQLAANALWSWLFFRWHLGGAAFAEIVLLWVMVAGTIIAFWPLNRLAAMLLGPYLAWITFASALAFSTWQHNPMLLS